MRTIVIPLVISSVDTMLPMSVSDTNTLVPMGYESTITITTDVERYEGDYTVTPRAFTDQVLDTKNKMMIDDLIVTKVPKFEVGNLSGTTVYIANE